MCVFLTDAGSAFVDDINGDRAIIAGMDAVLARGGDICRIAGTGKPPQAYAGRVGVRNSRLRNSGSGRQRAGTLQQQPVVSLRVLRQQTRLFALERRFQLHRLDR